ncbi:MAG: hypothetical protein Q9227_006241 [Pyrenula ochraceoflavens]
MAHPTSKNGPGPPPSRSFFDPWNSSSTGHQRAENRLAGSTSWRQSRNYKLSHQFRDPSREGGTGHKADLVGAGSENFGRDGRQKNGSWESGAPGLREPGVTDIKSSFASAKRKWDGIRSADERAKRVLPNNQALDANQKSKITGSDGDTQTQPAQKKPTRLFAGVTIYLNGTTTPLVSDHRLKQLLAQHGGNVSIALGRRTVSHVILGERGGLSSSKIQKEIIRKGGKGVKYVSARW